MLLIYVTLLISDHIQYSTNLWTVALFGRTTNVAALRIKQVMWCLWAHGGLHLCLFVYFYHLSIHCYDKVCLMIGDSKAGAQLSTSELSVVWLQHLFFRFIVRPLWYDFIASKSFSLPSMIISICLLRGVPFV